MYLKKLPFFFFFLWILRWFAPKIWLIRFAWKNLDFICKIIEGLPCLILRYLDQYYTCNKRQNHISCKIALRWMPLDLTDDKSTLVQVIALCHHATSHYLSQFWPRSLSSYGVTRPEWVNMFNSWLLWLITWPYHIFAVLVISLW